MRVDHAKFIKARNELIGEVVEEMGHDAAYNYFSVESNRTAIEQIATHRVYWAPKRDLDTSKFRKNKWKKKRDDETPAMA